MDRLAASCLASAPLDAERTVRLPGQLALERKAAALRDGVELFADIPPALRAVAERLGLPPPAAR